MRIDTYGSKEKPCILLLHTMFTTGTLFEALIPVLVQDYFLVIPTLDGYDPDEKAEYPGADEELERIEAYLKGEQVQELAAAAGSSLGAGFRFTAWCWTARLLAGAPCRPRKIQKASGSWFRRCRPLRRRPVCLMRTTGNSVQECGAPAGTSLGIRSAVPVKRALALSCRSIFRAVAQKSFWFTVGRTPITSTRKRIWRIGRIFPWW